LTKVAHRAVEDVEVSRGGYRATGTGLAPLLGWEPITGLHFRLRSYAQFESKVRRDGRAADPKLQALRRVLYEHYSAGRLLEVYEQRVVDDAEAHAGVEEGRFVVDERLKRFFETAGREPPGEPTAEEIDALRAEMEHALEERDRHPLTADIRHLEERLETAEGWLAKQLDAVERLQRKRTRLDARIAYLQNERDAARRQRDAARRKLRAGRRERKQLRAELEQARRPLARLRDLTTRAATAVRAATRP
jgi:chromosome segregation ATPase